MVGREAYHNPWWLASWDALYYQDGSIERSRESVEEQMVLYMEHEAREHGTHWYSIARHMLGLRNGLAGAAAGARSGAITSSRPYLHTK